MAAMNDNIAKQEDYVLSRHIAFLDPNRKRGQA